MALFVSDRRPECGEDDFVKEKVCYALTECLLVEEDCPDGCQSGHRRLAKVRMKVRGSSYNLPFLGRSSTRTAKGSKNTETRAVITLV